MKHLALARPVQESHRPVSVRVPGELREEKSKILRKESKISRIKRNRVRAWPLHARSLLAQMRCGRACAVRP